MDPKTEAHQRVVAYLHQHKSRLAVMTLDFIVRDVRLFGPDTSALTDYEVRSTAAVWRSLNGPLVPLPSPVARTPAENKMIAAVKKAVGTAIDGVDLSYGPGTINISVVGPTAELKKGDMRLAAGVTWTGTLGVEAQAGNFHLAGELSADKWSVTLSYPDDNIIPDLGKLGQVFGDGEKAMRGILGALSGFKTLDDAARIKTAIEPHLKPAKDALDAAKGAAKATPKRVHFGLTLGSPDPHPGETGIPKGIQGQLTLTIRFGSRE